jgi:hypothetical protein
VREHERPVGKEDFLLFVKVRRGDLPQPLKKRLVNERAGVFPEAFAVAADGRLRRDALAAETIRVAPGRFSAGAFQAEYPASAAVFVTAQQPPGFLVREQPSGALKDQDGFELVA